MLVKLEWNNVAQISERTSDTQQNIKNNIIAILLQTDETTATPNIFLLCLLNLNFLLWLLVWSNDSLEIISNFSFTFIEATKE